MSQRKVTNDIPQPKAVSAEDFSLDLCDKTRRKNEIFTEKSAMPTPEQQKLEEPPRERSSSSEGDNLQETPIDFSLPKRIKLNSNGQQPFSDQKAHYVSSSPPLDMSSSQRTSPDHMHDLESNGSSSPSNFYSEHSDSSSNFERFQNGHMVAARLSPEMMVRERSHSFSSLNKIRRPIASRHSHGMLSSSGIGPLSTHHLNDPALIKNVTLPASYADRIPQSLPGCPSPTGISGLTPDEVIELYNDRIDKASNDDRHYAFLSSGVPSCIAENLNRNGMLTSHPSVLPPSLASIPAGSVAPAVSSITHNAQDGAKVTSTSPTQCVTTSSRATTAKRRPRSLPEEQKDGAYWERRRKNNEAAKRSRDARRLKEEEIALRANFLEQENLKLRCEVATLKTETEKLKVLLYDN